MAERQQQPAKPIEPTKSVQPVSKTVELLTKRYEVTEVAGMVNKTCRSRRTTTNILPVDTRTLEIADEDWEKASTLFRVHANVTQVRGSLIPTTTTLYTHSGARFT